MSRLPASTPRNDASCRSFVANDSIDLPPGEILANYGVNFQHRTACLTFHLTHAQ